jgi:Winged helix DNA-binding domain
VRTIGIEERRRRLAARHLLAAPSRTVEAAAGAVVGLHSSDPASVYLSAWARVRSFAPEDLEAALYERRTLVRMLGMRRTMFVVPRSLAASMAEACATTYAAAERRRLVQMLEAQGIVAEGAGARWLRRVLDRTMAAVESRAETTARELTKDVPELGAKLAFGEGKTWAGTMGVSTRVLFLLATEGRIVRARPLGSWISGQYRWAATEAWLGTALEEVDRRHACAELLRRYLRAFGPATQIDMRWWTGWTAKVTSQALADVGAAEVRLDDGAAYVLPDDVRAASRARRGWVAFLPGLDPTVMGWKQRGWYLGEHERTLFDRAGNAGPTVWADGRVVGGWTQNKAGDVVYELLERVDRATRRSIERERGRLQEWLGDVRVRARFGTPFERALASR